MMIRSLVLVLVCMNLAAGGWLWWRSASAPAGPAGAPAIEDTHSLVLLNEVERLPEPPAWVEPDAPPEPFEAASQCLRLGPFESPAAQRQALALLQPVVSRIRDSQTQVDSAQDHRVFISRSANREQALAVARELAARGVSDYYVVTSGELENSISLGLFRSRENAERRIAQVAALGFTAQLESRTESQVQWWLEVAANPDFSLDGALGDAESIPSRTIDCAVLDEEQNDPVR